MKELGSLKRYCARGVCGPKDADGFNPYNQTNHAEPFGSKSSLYPYWVTGCPQLNPDSQNLIAVCCGRSLVCVRNIHIMRHGNGCGCRVLNGKRRMAHNYSHNGKFLLTEMVNRKWSATKTFVSQGHPLASTHSIRLGASNRGPSAPMQGRSRQLRQMNSPQCRRRQKMWLPRHSWAKYTNGTGMRQHREY